MIALVFVGGFVGGILRHLLVTWLAPRGAADLPVGLLVANVAGSFALGLFAQLALGSGHALLGTGLCGSLTTFSSFAVELASSWRAGHRWTALAHAALTISLGWTAAAAGFVVGDLV